MLPDHEVLELARNIQLNEYLDCDPDYEDMCKNITCRTYEIKDALASLILESMKYGFDRSTVIDAINMELEEVL